MKITATMMSMMMIMLMMLTMTSLISKKNKMSREKNKPFECGFSNISSARMPFSTHFFLIAMMFLIFDIEISMILPMYSTKMIKMDEWMYTSMTIIMILMAGLIHEWNNGMLEWSK
uniref:NADH-ubiquinone oxidoreductase chain 3 n=1 Tax=Achilidae gen. 1 sp. n. 1 SX-2018 TaxID=2232070 RepID=A0A3S5XHP6_9HEMI|nr:NADH dehydrogenase subunit 3 [Achilidae gen. 1 sp. n. 1 SX-2018]